MSAQFDYRASRTAETLMDERLAEEARFACPADGFTTEDCDTLLASDDRLLGLALAYYDHEIDEALRAEDFARRVSRLYIECGSTRAGSPERAAAQSMLTHTLRNQFEAIARACLAPLIRVRLNDMANSP